MPQSNPKEFCDSSGSDNWGSFAASPKGHGQCFVGKHKQAIVSLCAKLFVCKSFHTAVLCSYSWLGCLSRLAKTCYFVAKAQDENLLAVDIA